MAVGASCLIFSSVFIWLACAAARVGGDGARSCLSFAWWGRVCLYVCEEVASCGFFSFLFFFLCPVRNNKTRQKPEPFKNIDSPTEKKQRKNQPTQAQKQPPCNRQKHSPHAFVSFSHHADDRNAELDSGNHQSHFSTDWALRMASLACTSSSVSDLAIRKASALAYLSCVLGSM